MLHRESRDLNVASLMFHDFFFGRKRKISAKNQARLAPEDAKSIFHASCMVIATFNLQFPRKVIHYFARLVFAKKCTRIQQNFREKVSLAKVRLPQIGKTSRCLDFERIFTIHSLSFLCGCSSHPRRPSDAKG